MDLTTYSKGFRNTAIYFFLVYSVMSLTAYVFLGNYSHVLDNNYPIGFEQSLWITLLASTIGMIIIHCMFLFKSNILIYNLNLFQSKTMLNNVNIQLIWIITYQLQLSGLLNASGTNLIRNLSYLEPTVV